MSRQRPTDRPGTDSLSTATLLRQQMAKGQLMHLATVSVGGDPWLCHVWYAVDANLDIVFTSRVTRRHSIELRETGRVAGGVVPIALEGLGQKVQGITFEGSAVEVEGHDLRAAYETYVARWPQFENMTSLDDLLGQASESRLYRVKPIKYVVFDEHAFPTDPRRELTEW